MKKIIMAFCLAAGIFYLFESFFQSTDMEVADLEEKNKNIEYKTSIEDNTKKKIIATSKPTQKKSKSSPKAAKASPKNPPSNTSADKKAYFKKLAENNLVTFERWNDLAVYDGDIIIGPLEDNQIKKGYVEFKEPQKWPSNLIGYYFDKNVSSETQKTIKNAMSYFTRYGLLKFTDKIKEGDDFLFFTSPEADKCASFLGRQGGGQPVFIGQNCDLTAVLHEILHALGFIHEHSRFDRDQFVEIYWENVKPGKVEQFAIVPQIYTLRAQQDDFDYRSIMLYQKTAFSLNGGPTLESINRRDQLEPTKSGLSPNDLKRLRRYFE